MDEKLAYKIRLNLVLKTLEMTAMTISDQDFLNWVESKRREFIRIKDESGFKVLLEEVDTFFKANLDIIQLYETQQNRCNAKSFREPLKVSCVNCRY